MAEGRSIGRNTLGAVLFAVGLFAGCSKESQPNPERPPAPVTTAAATAQDVPLYIDAVGKIVAREVVSIQPQVSGRIVKIHFTDGADVKTGDLLFTIDPRPFQAQLNQNRAAVENARLNLEYCTIRSPINGRAGQRNVDAGNVVSANNSTLLVIQRLDPIYADFTVTENELTAVQQNMSNRALTVEVRLPDDAASMREGKLTFLDNSVQEGSGTVKLRATLSNGDRRFWPGRFAKVRLVLETRRDAVLVPADAPQLSAKGSFVYVINGDSSA